MNRSPLLALVCAAIAFPGPIAAKTPKTASLQPARAPLHATSLDIRNPQRLHSTLPPDTTQLGSWDFDGCDPQGWISVDRTAQTGDYWHVDDFAGLGGGSNGLLHAPEGNQAMWCGLRPDNASPEICGYASLPGYANNWDQCFETVNCIDVTGDVTVTFLAAWDSEPGWDGLCAEFSLCDGEWIDLDTLTPGYHTHCYDGTGWGAVSRTIPDSLYTSPIRIRFRFTSDVAYSDEDGLYQSDGGFILDSLAVTDGGGLVIPVETFESEAVGDHATASGNWTSEPGPGYGDFAALFDGMTVLQEDVCRSNASCIWAFFNGSTYDYSCGGHPEQLAVPYENERGQNLVNEIWSPWITLTGSGDRYVLDFDVYGDLKFIDLVFYQPRVRSLVDGCATPWVSDIFVFHEPEKIWKRHRFEFDQYVEPGATAVQVAIRAIEDVAIFPDDPDCHSHAPLIDNVSIYRVGSLGPEWDVEAVHLFQDNFPSDGTITGTVRADMAANLTFSSNIRPGDSTVVEIATPASESGLLIDPHTGTGPAAYCYVSVKPDQPGKRGAALSDTPARWPVVDSLTAGGKQWYAVRMDSVSVSGAVAADRYCVDLNDNLFTPGDTVSFFFGATNGALTAYWSEYTGQVYSLAEAAASPMEFTCLPTMTAAQPRVLYVDYADGSGSQTAFDAAFDALGLGAQVDRYDVRGPDEFGDNGPGSRVVDPIVQLSDVYDIIVWSGGPTFHSFGRPGNKTNRSDDEALVTAFMGVPCPGGVYFSGDDIATAVADAWVPWLGIQVIAPDHLNAGYDPSPLVVAEPGRCFDHADSDSLVAAHGCYPINRFDVIAPTGTATLEASYRSGGNGGAIVAQRTDECAGPNGGSAGGVILSGFGFEQIRNDKASPVDDATAHLADVIAWLLDVPSDVPEMSRRQTTLAQNYPNPFNPATTIRFSVRERGRVQLKVYNVAGQLITTLVDGVVESGVEHAVEWDGRNTAGQRVATGVYFYRMTAPGFTRTRKMVLLK